MKYLVEALNTYEELQCNDNELKRIPRVGEQWEVSKERLDVLLGKNEYKATFVKLIQPIEEIEEAVIQTPAKEKATKKKSK